MRYLASASFLILGACLAPATAVAPAPQLAQALTELLALPALAGGRIGVCVVDAASGATLVEAAADRGFAPASNLKLITSAVALQSLGAEFQFRTGLALRGKVRDGVLHGDLVLHGRGDPALGTGPAAAEVVAHFAKELRERGIRAVAGRVIGDASWLGDEHLGHGWQWDYLDEDYAAPFGGLCWGGNVQKVRLEPVEGLVRVTIDPAVGPAPQSSVELTPRGGATCIVVHRDLGSEQIRITGTMAVDATPQTLAVTVADPTLFAARSLTHALRSVGIDVRGDAGTGAADVAAAVQVREWPSPPLARLLEPVLRDSDNLHAEQLFRAAARVTQGAGTSAVAAQHAMAVLTALGVDCAGMVLADGSGLTRRDLVQPRQLARLLVAMDRAPQREAFLDALPIAAGTGTLRARFRDTPAAGRVRGKTGTIARVACLSGYVPRANGAPLVFSIMLNDFTCSDAEARAAIDAFVLQLVAFADASAVGSVRT